MESIHQLPDDDPQGRYLLLYDPVDGSFNINENATIGTIFSILRRPEGATGRPDPGEFLQTGTSQVCAGYAVYGPSCMIVMTTGRGTNGFTLDPLVGEFILTHPAMSIPGGSDRLYANISWLAEWDEPFRGYVTERLNGTSDLRWSRCAAADIHRVLMTGGIYISAANEPLRQDGHSGVLRQLYEVNPLAFVVEQAGGLASDGQQRLLDVPCNALHQRSSAVMGSREHVDYFLEKYQQ
jgi:fructose-1,6-bisphosphatase I